MQPKGGDEVRPKTQVLAAGSEVLQGNAPADKLDIYLVGFHPMKDEPAHQMEAHHYCFQVNEDFAQCVLWDSNTADANLNGIEYIISEKLFEDLPAAERQYWHPHNYEILSGQLRAPGIPAAAEHALMKSKMNSYGKTWHVWNTGGVGGHADALPLGPPRLAWSFNADGESAPALIQARDEAMDLDSAQARERRQDLTELARPQHGVDLLGDAFPQRRKPPGVNAAESTDSTAVE